MKTQPQQILKQFYIILFLTLFIPVTHAGIINFDFTDDSPTIHNNLSLSSSGINLTISGWYENPAKTGYILGEIHQDSNGLGVFNSVTSNNDGFQVDGLGDDEWLNFYFSSAVTLYSIQFTRVGKNDDFSLKVDNTLLLQNNIPGGNETDELGISLVAFESFDFSGTQFSLGVDRWFSDYKISSISVTRIPEPNTISLFGIMLLIFWVLRKQNPIQSKQFHQPIEL